MGSRLSMMFVSANTDMLVTAKARGRLTQRFPLDRLSYNMTLNGV